MFAAPPINQLDGKYRVLAQLGQGGTANVSLAALRGPSGFNKLVVLKSMKHSLKAEPEFARMFMMEARLAARLSHPNIVQTNEVFEFHGLPIIVMEYLEGQPLSNILSRAAERGGFPLAMHLRVISDALSGLQYAHELRDYDGTPLCVVHRDVSPHNVFVTFEGQVKLLDFGIAKLGSVGGDTSTGVIKGKLRYMPPEQVAAEGVDRRSDIYSAGVMLWEAATGRKMWQGMSDATVMNRILNGELVKVHDLKPDVAPELEGIIDQALASEPEHRFATAREMQAALDDYIARLGAPVHQRDLGKAVAELFADVRQQTRDIIEEQLSRIASLPESEYEKVQPIELTAFATGFGPSAGPASASGSRPGIAGRTRGVLAAALIVAVIALLLAAGWQLFEAKEPRVASLPARASGVAAPEPAAPSRVSLRVTAFPATARLYLGGELLPSNPSARSFVRDPARSVMLVAEAKGHQSETRIIKLDQDWDIVLTLESKPEVVETPRPKPSPHPKSPARSADSAAPPASGPDCNPPHFFDERGIKKYKPGCL